MFFTEYVQPDEDPECPATRPLETLSDRGYDLRAGDQKGRPVPLMQVSEPIASRLAGLGMNIVFGGVGENVAGLTPSVEHSENIRTGYHSRWAGSIAHGVRPRHVRGMIRAPARPTFDAG